jgi:hypothetical protein
MIFRQLFEPESSTYTYLLSCPDTGVTALIDPVIETVDRDLQIMDSMDLPYPRKIDWALPGNEGCGSCPDNLPPDKERLCEIDRQG